VKIRLTDVAPNARKELEKAACIAQCEVSAYARSCRRCIATYWKEQTRRSQNCKISPVIVNGFRNGFHQWIQRIFLVLVEAKVFFRKFFFGFRNLDALCRPVAGKPLVLEDL